MSSSHKFDPNKLAKLDSPERRKKLPINQVLKKLPIESGSTIADIGCGIGYFTLPLARLVGDNGLVYAMDIEEVMIQETKRRANEAGLKNINYVITEESILPIADQLVDGALLVCLYHELKQPTQFLMEVKRILKLNGTICIVDWKKEATEGGPPIDHRVSVEEVAVSLEKLGFKTINLFNVSESFYGVIANLNILECDLSETN